MSTIWNIFWKDLVRFRILLGAWTLLIVTKYLFFSYLAGVWGDANFALLGGLQSGLGLFLSFAIEPLAAYFLVAGLVYEDPPAGKDPFWLTRPVSGGQLLLAKLLFAGLMFVVWPVLLSLPWWIECGYGSTDLAVVLGGMAVIYSTAVLTGLACASATDAHPRYILWTLAAFAIVAIVLMLPALLRDVNIAPSPTAALVHAGVVVIALMLIALEIIRHQFVVRFFRRTLVVVVGGTLLGGALMFSSPLPGITSWFRPADREKPADETMQLSIAGPMRLEAFNKNPASALVIPVKIEGLPENADASLGVNGTWKSADSKQWSRHGGSSSRQLLIRASRHILNLPPADSALPVAEVRFVFNGRYAPGMTFAQLIAGQAVSFQGVAGLQVEEGKLRAELPVREQIKRVDGGSLSITRLERRGDQLTFNLTTRIPLSLNSWRGIGYIALVNRSTGELIEPALSSRLGIGAAQINLVQVMTGPVSFKIPATPGWLEGASFVMIGFERGRILGRGIEARPLAVAAAKTPAQVSPEILRQYVGTYTPRENATVSITLAGDHLVAKGADVPETILFPESETRFFTKTPEAVLDFVKNDASKVTQMIVHQNGRDLTVPRTSETAAP